MACADIRFALTVIHLASLQLSPYGTLLAAVAGPQRTDLALCEALLTRLGAHKNTHVRRDKEHGEASRGETQPICTRMLAARGARRGGAGRREGICEGGSTLDRYPPWVTPVFLRRYQGGPSSILGSVPVVMVESGGQARLCPSGASEHVLCPTALIVDASNFCLMQELHRLLFLARHYAGPG
jgi:hypothetical protein